MLGDSVIGITEYGESVVSVLSNQGEFELLKFVLNRGFAGGKLKWTPLLRAIAFEDDAAVQRALADSKDLEQRDSWGRTPFLLAAFSGRLNVVQMLASAGCQIDATGRCGATALEYSIRSDSVEVCRWLIEQGSIRPMESLRNRLSILRRRPGVTTASAIR